MTALDSHTTHNQSVTVGCFAWHSLVPFVPPFSPLGAESPEVSCFPHQHHVATFSWPCHQRYRPLTPEPYQGCRNTPCPSSRGLHVTLSGPPSFPAVCRSCNVVIFSPLSLAVPKSPTLTRGTAAKLPQRLSTNRFKVLTVSAHALSNSRLRIKQQLSNLNTNPAPFHCPRWANVSNFP